MVSITQQLDLSGPLGKTVAALLLGIAEMEMENLRERQAADISKARARGVRFGRPRSINVEVIRQLKGAGHGVFSIARRLGISGQSIYNAIQTTAA